MEFFNALSDWLWTYVVITMLVGCAIYFTWNLRGVQFTMLPTMLLHTYCQNAVKHGIANKRGDGNVSVSICHQKRGETDGVLVKVSDDGVGRVEAAHIGGSSTKQGLKILQQQIELYNRVNRTQIVQHVTDLTDAEGHPAGTCFEIWVPTEFKF